MTAAEQMEAVHRAAQRASDPKKPYGDVPYADPGYQADKKKRYPLTADKVVAAWTYINQSDNAKHYTPEQLALIKGRIKAAMKKFGHKVDESKSEAPAIDVVRAVDLAQEFRDANSEADGLGLLTGHFSVFDTWYPVQSRWEGDFLERVDRGAFTQTIAEDRGGMKVLFDHGFDNTVGNKVLGPIRDLRPDVRGAYYEVPLFDTSYNRDLLPGLRAGVYGASMRMQVLDDVWEEDDRAAYDNGKKTKRRTITRAKVHEFGPVTFPASPTASAGVRSMTDQFYDQLRQRDTSGYEAALRAVERSNPNFTAASEARSPERSEPPVGAVNSRQRLDDGALRLRGILR